MPHAKTTLSSGLTLTTTSRPKLIMAVAGTQLGEKETKQFAQYQILREKEKNKWVCILEKEKKEKKKREREILPGSKDG